MVERLVVIQVGVGSIPIKHPNYLCGGNGIHNWFKPSLLQVRILSEVRGGNYTERRKQEKIVEKSSSRERIYLKYSIPAIPL